MIRSSASRMILNQSRSLVRRSFPVAVRPQLDYYISSQTPSLGVVGSSRFLSSEAKEPKKDEKNEENQIVLTPGEQVVAASRLTMWAGVLALACTCGYFIVRELMPTKMSPNTVFNRALEKVRDHAEVKRRFGEPVKGYGRDHGGKRVGRRNFIEHSNYKDEEDGSNRTRVRFNLEGPQGTAFCFAEVSSKMKGGEFVYILVQDKLNGRVTTIVDNRAAMATARLSGGSEEGMEALSNLLTGGKK